MPPEPILASSSWAGTSVTALLEWDPVEGQDLPPIKEFGLKYLATVMTSTSRRVLVPATDSYVCLE